MSNSNKVDSNFWGQALGSLIRTAITGLGVYVASKSNGALSPEMLVGIAGVGIGALAGVHNKAVITGYLGGDNG